MDYTAFNEQLDLNIDVLLENTNSLMSDIENDFLTEGKLTDAIKSKIEKLKKFISRLLFKKRNLKKKKGNDAHNKKMDDLDQKIDSDIDKANDILDKLKIKPVKNKPKQSWEK